MGHHNLKHSIKHDSCGFLDLVPSKIRTRLRMYSSHKSHIKLTSTIIVNCISNDVYGILYELQFSDNTYTFWATEKDIQEIIKELEKLMSYTEVKRKREHDENEDDLRSKLKEHQKVYLSILGELYNKRDKEMLDTFPKSETISYVVENNYYCTIDDVSESKIEYDCTLKRCNEMVKGSMPPLFNCFKQCPRYQGKIECGSNHPKYSFCDNMFFTMRKFSRIYVFKTNNRGFGVKSKSNIKPNAFIISYTGGVFNNFTIKIILTSKSAVKTIGTYLQRLSDNNITCSYSNGNMSGFINHSCEPNARIERWVSGKRYVLGIFAITNISKDEEIIIDYGYGDVGEKCLCGTISCRGKIGYFSDENLGIIDGTGNTRRLKGGETNDNCTTSNSHEVNNNLLS